MKHNFGYKSIFIVLCSIALCLSIPSYASTSADWQGEYSKREKVDPEGIWFSKLSITNCKDNDCRFEFESGSGMSECSTNGLLHIENETTATHVDEIKPSGATDPRGICLVRFERKKNGALYVDAEDKFRKPEDEQFGSPCNSLCGAQGARYFGVEIPKHVSRTKASKK